MRKQIEVLKDCADPSAKFVHAPSVLAPGKRRLELDIRTLDRPTVDSLQTIQATQQSRLAAAGCANDAEHCLWLHFERDTTQNARAAGVLDEVCDANHLFSRLPLPQLQSLLGVGASALGVARD